MKIYTLIKHLYQELFRQCSLNTIFIYEPIKNEKKSILRFIKWFKSSYRHYTVDLLIKYFEYQFSRFEGTYSRGYGKNKIMITWIVGKKAIDNWNNRDISKNCKIKYKLNKEVCLRLNKLFNSQNRQQSITLFKNRLSLLSIQEESNKQRFFNKSEGLFYCIATTTLYNDKSKWCKSCINNQSCINYLQTNFKQLYNIRINESR